MSFLRRLLLWSQVIRPIAVLQNIFVIPAALMQVMVIPTETEVQTLVLAIPTETEVQTLVMAIPTETEVQTLVMAITTELTEAIGQQKVVYFL